MDDTPKRIRCMINTVSNPNPPFTFCVGMSLTSACRLAESFLWILSVAFTHMHL